MAREINRLSALKVAKLAGKGMYPDGAGLYLQIARGGSKSWIFRYKRDGKARDMGLGSARDFSLADARERAADCRRLLADGIDPLDARRERRRTQDLNAARAKTFDECAAGYIDAHEAGWRNPKHRQQWRNTLNTYVFPVFGKLSVADIDTDLVLRALEPVWTTKPETAGRVRGRIESILDWATTRGYRTGENPARWRGHLDHLLPKRSKVRRVRHHPALPYSQVGEFVIRLREMDNVSARALEFTILTAARTGEVLGALWDEIDPDGRVWTIPEERMKNSRQHRVPLSEPAVALLDSMRSTQRNDLVFPGNRPKRPLSNMALTMLLRRTGHPDITVHGFRSTFRDWAAECTAFPREVAEMALAHTIGDSVEAAYRRGDLFDKRRDLMEAWAEFVRTSPK